MSAVAERELVPALRGSVRLQKYNEAAYPSVEALAFVRGFVVWPAHPDAVARARGLSVPPLPAALRGKVYGTGEIVSSVLADVMHERGRATMPVQLTLEEQQASRQRQSKVGHFFAWIRDPRLGWMRIGEPFDDRAAAVRWANATRRRLGVRWRLRILQANSEVEPCDEALA
jgi:hypothetical protein